MPILYEKHESEITITGYEGTISHLQIPDALDGFPVTAIAHSAFSMRKDLVYARLPGTLRKLERFSFYGCPSLAKISLSDGIEEYCDGAFRNCGGLREAEIFLRNGHCSVLKELLADTDRAVTLLITMRDGFARLTFPEYLIENQEDTRARAIHFHIEGAGYHYRECVSRERIDFRSYDRSFDRIRLQDVPLSCRIAMDRLCFPYMLESRAADLYKEHLCSFGVEAAFQAILNRRPDWLELLTSGRMLSSDAVSEAIRFSSEQNLPEYVAQLTKSLPHNRKRTRLQL